MSQKIQCQESASVSAPPSTGPSVAANPATAPQAPSATPRRRAGTAALRIVRLSGARTAPPAPWSARAATSAPIEGASAAASDPTVKIATPAMNSRRRPKRSPSAAPVSNSTAKVSVYALTVHWSVCRLAPRSSWIAGSAVVTISRSRLNMNSAAAVSANVQPVPAPSLRPIDSGGSATGIA